MAGGGYPSCHETELTMVDGKEVLGRRIGGCVRKLSRCAVRKPSSLLSHEVARMSSLNRDLPDGRNPLVGVEAAAVAKKVLDKPNLPNACRTRAHVRADRAACFFRGWLASVCCGRDAGVKKQMVRRPGASHREGPCQHHQHRARVAPWPTVVFDRKGTWHDSK